MYRTYLESKPWIQPWNPCISFCTHVVGTIHITPVLAVPGIVAHRFEFMLKIPKAWTNLIENISTVIGSSTSSDDSLNNFLINQFGPFKFSGLQYDAFCRVVLTDRCNSMVTVRVRLEINTEAPPIARWIKSVGNRRRDLFIILFYPRWQRSHKLKNDSTDNFIPARIKCLCVTKKKEKFVVDNLSDYIQSDFDLAYRPSDVYRI